MPIAFLRSRADYLALRDGARAQSPSFLVVKRFRNDGDSTVRIGLTVTRKIGNAVLRNRVRRRLREAARAIAPVSGEEGCDYALIARRAAATRPFPDLLDDLRRALLSLARRST